MNYSWQEGSVTQKVLYTCWLILKVNLEVFPLGDMPYSSMEIQEQWVPDTHFLYWLSV